MSADQPPGAAPRAPDTSGNAIASLVLGILSFLACPFLFAIAAIVLGRRGRKEVERSDGRVAGAGLAKAGTILGVVNLLLGLAVAAVVAGLILVVDSTPEDLIVGPGSEEDPARVEEDPADGAAPASLDGTWSVVEGDETRVQLAIEEELTGLPDHTATGETPGVSGSLTIDGSQVTAVDVTVDLTRLEFTDSPGGLPVGNRRRALGNQGLDIDRFPEATFSLTRPIDIGDHPSRGEVRTAEATGDLTLHGVTNEITFPVEARVVGDRILVAAVGAVPIVLADYAIEKPTAPVVLSVADEGTFDFVITFTQG